MQVTLRAEKKNLEDTSSPSPPEFSRIKVLVSFRLREKTVSFFALYLIEQL